MSSATFMHKVNAFCQIDKKSTMYSLFLLCRVTDTSKVYTLDCFDEILKDFENIEAGLYIFQLWIQIQVFWSDPVFKIVQI